MQVTLALTNKQKVTEKPFFYGLRSFDNGDENKMCGECDRCSVSKYDYGRKSTRHRGNSKESVPRTTNKISTTSI